MKPSMDSLYGIVCAAVLLLVLAAAGLAGEMAYSPEEEIAKTEEEVANEQADATLDDRMQAIEDVYRDDLAKAAVMPDFIRAALTRYEEYDRLLAEVVDGKIYDLAAQTGLPGQKDILALIRNNNASWLRLRKAVMNSMSGEGGGRRPFNALEAGGTMTAERIRFIDGLFRFEASLRLPDLKLDGSKLVQGNESRDPPHGILTVDGAPMRVAPLDGEAAEWAGAAAGLHFFLEEGEYLGCLPIEEAADCSAVYMSPGRSVVAVDRGKSVNRDLVFFTFPGFEPRPEGVVRTTAVTGPGVVWVDDTTVLVNTSSFADERGCVDSRCDVVSVTVYDVEAGTPTTFRQGSLLCDCSINDYSNGVLAVDRRCYPDTRDWREDNRDRAVVSTETIPLTRASLPAVRRLEIANATGRDLDEIYAHYDTFYVRLARGVSRSARVGVAVPANAGRIGIHAVMGGEMYSFDLPALPKADRVVIGVDGREPYLAPVDARGAEEERTPGIVEEAPVG